MNEVRCQILFNRELFRSVKNCPVRISNEPKRKLNDLFLPNIQISERLRENVRNNKYGIDYRVTKYMCVCSLELSVDVRTTTETHQGPFSSGSLVEALGEAASATMTGVAVPQAATASRALDVPERWWTFLGELIW